VGRAHHRRFLVTPEAVGDGQVRFSPAQSRQIAAVLRLRAGDLVTVFDGSGREWTARLTRSAPHAATADLNEEHPPEPSPRLQLALAQVVPRGAAMDLIVGKATELGVSRIVPLEAERSVRRRAGSGPTARWRRILAEAAEQCGRRRLPDLAEPCAFEEFLRTHSRDCPLLACDNGKDAVPLATACRPLVGATTVTVVVGGEGGLSLEEVDRVRSVGGQLVTLGPRLLRAETAALAALAVVQAYVGDWTSAGC
jgi:16S rRNA (uracil1498-N3)-methyltransferase